MAPNVPYSMNRKNRWSEIAAASLLANNSAAGQPNVEVAVVERVYTAKSECAYDLDPTKVANVCRRERDSRAFAGRRRLDPDHSSQGQGNIGRIIGEIGNKKTLLSLPR